MPHDLTPADLAGPMDAEERADELTEEFFVTFPHQPYPAFRDALAKHIRHAERAAREDERRKVVEEVVELCELRALTLIVPEIRALKDKP